MIKDKEAIAPKTVEDGISPLTAVLIYRHVNQIGQKPNSRSYSGIVAVPSGHFAVYGGSSLSVFNDLRTLEPDSMTWKM